MTHEPLDSPRRRRAAVLNESRCIVLHDSAEFAATAWSRTIGFMFRDPSDRALVFDLGRTTMFSIHTFCVRAPLDALALDYRLDVVALVQGLAPNRTWTPAAPARWLVEFGAGKIGSTKTAIGDRLAFTFF